MSNTRALMKGAHLDTAPIPVGQTCRSAPISPPASGAKRAAEWTKTSLLSFSLQFRRRSSAALPGGSVKMHPTPARLHFLNFCLPATAGQNHAVAAMLPISDPARPPAARRKSWLAKITIFLIVSALLGWAYGWAASRAFPKEKTFGFGYGMLHGALMPLALPSLLLGRDVEIFAADNSGRPYKIGYICGINACGLAFFGPLFWRPKRGAAAYKSQRR